MVTKRTLIALCPLGVLVVSLILLPSVAFADSPIISFDAVVKDQSSGPGAITLAWRTGVELGTAGFNLYRGEKWGGALNKLNANLIPTGTDAIAGGQYSYVDTNVGEGQTYYYQLETIGLDGKAMRSHVLESRLLTTVTVKDNTVPLLPLSLAFVAMLGTITIATRSFRMRLSLRFVRPTS